MNPDSPLNKNRDAYRIVMNTMKQLGHDVDLIRDTNSRIVSLRINFTSMLIQVNSSGAFPRTPAPVEPCVIGVYCPVTNEIAFYRSELEVSNHADGDENVAAWRRIWITR